MTMIYVVMWEEGEYSDRTTGVECAFFDEEKAKQYVLDADAKARIYVEWESRLEKHKKSLGYSGVLFRNGVTTDEQVKDRDATLAAIMAFALEKAGPRPEGADRGYWYEMAEIE